MDGLRLPAPGISSGAAGRRRRLCSRPDGRGRGSFGTDRPPLRADAGERASESGGAARRASPPNLAPARRGRHPRVGPRLRAKPAATRTPGGDPRLDRPRWPAPKPRSQVHLKRVASLSERQHGWKDSNLRQTVCRPSLSPLSYIQGPRRCEPTLAYADRRAGRTGGGEKLRPLGFGRAGRDGPYRGNHPWRSTEMRGALARTRKTLQCCITVVARHRAFAGTGRNCYDSALREGGRPWTSSFTTIRTAAHLGTRSH